MQLADVMVLLLQHTVIALMFLHLKQVWMWRRLISAWETQMLILTTHCLKWSKMLRYAQV